jgi:murein DD-endopeptidase MepM/ murein hydrolase activator NlpD
VIFPVAGPATFSRDFDPAGERGRRHSGIDLMADAGTPVVAAEDGEVRLGTNVLGGNIANLYADDGTRFYYAHLSGFEGIARRVAAGEVIGYVGNTGNAAGGPPHLHFEVHPGNGPAVDPYPFLMSAPHVSAGRPFGHAVARAAVAIALCGVIAFAISPAATRRAILALG